MLSLIKIWMSANYKEYLNLFEKSTKAADCIGCLLHYTLCRRAPKPMIVDLCCERVPIDKKFKYISREFQNI